MSNINLDRFKVKPMQTISLSHRNTEIDLNFKNHQALLNAIDENCERLNEWQQKLLAEEKRGLIFALQAMDAAGKDEAERFLFSKLSSQALKTSSFQEPSEEELRHDYLWRFAPAMPKRGEIGVFNRSHYEQVIGNRVQESYLEEKLPDHALNENLWQQRYKHIRNFEEYLADNGFYMIKIYFHISKETQKERLLERMEDPDHQWEFSMSDLEDREKWDAFMSVFEETFSQTSTDIAPWYIIPADNGDIGRYILSEILLSKFEEMDPQFPTLSKKERDQIEEAAQKLRDGYYD